MKPILLLLISAGMAGALSDTVTLPIPQEEMTAVSAMYTQLAQYQSQVRASVGKIEKRVCVEQKTIAVDKCVVDWQSGVIKEKPLQ